MYGSKDDGRVEGSFEEFVDAETWVRDIEKSFMPQGGCAYALFTIVKHLRGDSDFVSEMKKANATDLIEKADKEISKGKKNKV